MTSIPLTLLRHISPLQSTPLKSDFSPPLVAGGKMGDELTGGEMSLYLTSNIIYKATVTTDNNTAHYIGSSETEFKTRYNNHTASFRHASKKNATSLSAHIHKQKEQNKTPIVKWEILTKCHPYNQGSRKCDLCLSEKMHILTDTSNKLLNVKGELINKCRHRAKTKLKNIQ